MTTRVATLPRMRVSQKGTVHARIRVVPTFARLCGRGERWALRALYEHPTVRFMTVNAISAYRLSGDDLGLARFSAPVRTALDDLGGTPYSRQLAVDTQSIDLAEDSSEKAFDANPCRETAGPWHRDIGREIIAMCRLHDALGSEYNL